MSGNHDDQPPRSESRPLLQTDAPAPSSTVPAQVLVIDDSEIAREEITRLLRGAGVQVASLPSPIGATQAIVRYQTRVVIIDVDMPAIRGDRLLTVLKRAPRIGRLYTILVSGLYEHELEQMQTEVQADAILPKRHLDRLPALVKRLLSQDR